MGGASGVGQSESADLQPVSTEAEQSPEPTSPGKGQADRVRQKTLPTQERPPVDRPSLSKGQRAIKWLTAPFRLLGRMFSAAAKVFHFKSAPAASPSFPPTTLGWGEGGRPPEEAMKREPTRDLLGLSGFPQKAYDDLHRRMIYQGEEKLGKDEDIKDMHDDMTRKMGDVGTPEQRSHAAFIAMRGLFQDYEQPSCMKITMAGAEKGLMTAQSEGSSRSIHVERDGDNLVVSVSSRYDYRDSSNQLAGDIEECTRKFSVNVLTGASTPLGETYASVPRR